MGILSTIATFVGGVLVGNYLKPFIRDLLSGRGVVQAVQKPREGEFRRKIVKSAFYCERRGGLAKHDKKLVYAVTFEPNDTDRFDELVSEIELIYGSDVELHEPAPEIDRDEGTNPRRQNCTRTSPYGYDDETLYPDPPFQYPRIEVGEE